MAGENSVRSAQSGQSGLSNEHQNKTTLMIKQALFKPQAKGWVEKWETIYKEAIFQTMVALVKEIESKSIPLFGLLIEFVQLFAFVFPEINWGPYGNKFGKAIRYTQFEYIFYSFLGIEDDAAAGWKYPLMDYQVTGFWIMLVFVTALVLAMISIFVYVFWSFVSKSFAAGVAPLRILRFLVSILCGVLYIPILHVMASAIVLKVEGVAALGYLGLITALPFCFMMAFTYFNPNPKSKELLARLAPSLEVIDMLLRTSVVLLEIFLHDYPVVRVSAVAVLTIFAAFFIIQSFPYYNKRVNMLKFTLYNLLAFGSLLGIAVAKLAGHPLYDDESKGTPFFWVLLGVSVPVATLSPIVCSWIYERSTTVVYQSLVDSSLYEMINGQKAWPVSNLSKVKFISPYNVEVATRYLRNINFETIPGKNALSAAETILERGLEQFPESSVMLVFYAIYHGQYRKNFSMWKTYLDKAEKMTNNLYLGLLIAQSRSQRESEMRKAKMGDETLDLLDFIEIKNSLKLAKRRSQKYKDTYMELWKLLLIGKVEPDKVHRLINKMHSSKSTAKELLKEIVMKYFNNAAAVSYYAEYLEEVERDYEEADGLWEYAEELKEKIVKQQRKTGTIKEEAELIEYEYKVGKGEIKEQSMTSLASSVGGMSYSSNADSVARSSMMSTVNRKKRGITRKQIKEYQEHRSRVLRLHSNSIPAVKKVVNFSFLLFLIPPLIQLIWVETIRAQISETVDYIRISGIRSEQSVIAATNVLQMRDLIETNSSEASGFTTFRRYYLDQNAERGYYTEYGDNYIPVEYLSLRNQTLNLFEEFEDIQFKLFLNLDVSKPLFRKWQLPFVNLSISTGPNSPRWENPLSFFDASSEFWRNGRNVINFPNPVYKYKTSMNSSDYVDNDFNWRFVMDSFPFTYADAFDAGTRDFTNSNQEEILNLLQYNWIILGVAAAIIIIVGVVFIRPSINRVFSEYQLATASLLGIPMDAIGDEYAKLKDILNYEDKKSRKKKSIKSFNETEEDETEKPKNDGDKKEGEGSDDDDDDDDTGLGDLTEQSSKSNSGVYLRLTLSYAISLLVIIGLFSSLSITTYLNCKKLIDDGNRAEQGIKIRYVIRRIGYDIEMLIRNDLSTYPDIQVPRDNLEKDFNIYNAVQVALLFGDPSLGIERGRLPDEQKPNMFTYEHVYLDNIQSTDESVNTLLQDVATLMRRKLPFSRNDKEAQSALERIPKIVQGFTEVGDTNQALLLGELYTLANVIRTLFGVVVSVLLLIYWIVFRRVIKGLEVEHEKAMMMLLQIPPISTKLIYAFQVLLNGKEAAKDYYHDQTVIGIKFDEVGFPLPEAGIPNPAFVKRICKSSSLDDSKKSLFSIFNRKEAGEDDESWQKRKLKRKPKKPVEDEEEKEVEKNLILKSSEISQDENKIAPVPMESQTKSESTDSNLDLKPTSRFGRLKMNGSFLNMTRFRSKELLSSQNDVSPQETPSLVNSNLASLPTPETTKKLSPQSSLINVMRAKARRSSIAETPEDETNTENDNNQ